MSISTTTNRWSYVGNGVTTAFAYTNKILASTDLKVYLETVADGTLTLQTETTHYTVSGAGAAGGGNVNFVTPPSSAYNVVIVREVPYTQPAEFDPRKQQSPSGTEDAFDRATILVQQVLDRLSRTIGLANGKSSPASLNGLTGDLASKYLGFDADEQPVALDAPANTTAVSTYMAALLLTASEAAFKAAANLEAGTDVQAYAVALAAIAALTPAANKLPYFTSGSAAALADLSAFARTLLDDADAATARATLGATQIVAGAALTKNPLAASTTTTQAHGLAGEPKFCQVILECVVADNAWDVGDRIDLSSGQMLGAAATRNVNIAVDATNVRLFVDAGSGGLLFSVCDEDNTAAFEITLTSWKIVVTPYYWA